MTWNSRKKCGGDGNDLSQGQTANAAGGHWIRKCQVRGALSAGWQVVLRARPKGAGEERGPVSTSITRVDHIDGAAGDLERSMAGRWGKLAVVGDRVTIKAPQSVHALALGGAGRGMIPIKCRCMWDMDSKGNDDE